MPFVTYAQNLEDVVLHRALSDVVRGHYIDVGANHPSFDSVTRAFYDRGWRGINVEPIERMANLLESERPGDVNIRGLVGERSGTQTFYEIADGSGLSTVVQGYAEELCRTHGVTCRLHELRVRTLDEIIEGSAFDEFHFLKIDVEGAEASVIKGIDLTRRRPWIIVVEAHEPLNQIQSHAAWEGLVTGRGYTMVYGDGLNRFYLADEHADLRGRFAHPPNVFDEVVPFQLVQIRGHQDQMIRQLRDVLERVGILFTGPGAAGNALEHFRDIQAWSEQAAKVIALLGESLARERSGHTLLLQERQSRDEALHEEVDSLRGQLARLHAEVDSMTTAAAADRAARARQTEEILELLRRLSAEAEKRRASPPAVDAVGRFLRGRWDGATAWWLSIRGPSSARRDQNAVCRDGRRPDATTGTGRADDSPEGKAGDLGRAA